MIQRGLSPENWARVEAIITHAGLTLAIARDLPMLTMTEREEVYVAVIDRLARMRGWMVRREVSFDHDGGE